MTLSITQIFKTRISRLLTIVFILVSLSSSAQLKLGDSAPEIKLPDSLGKWTKLSDVKTDYVLIDFWAAWCPPCVVTAQELKKIKEEYSTASFEIFALSLDRDYYNWVKTVRKLDLPFIHVNDAYGLRSPRCKDYNVRSIPSKFLVYKGKIIAINPSYDQIRNYLGKKD